MERLVAFDFDGVLVDARGEIVRAAVKTFNEFFSGHLELEDAMIAFANARHLIRTGRDVMPVMVFIASGRDMLSVKRDEIVELKREWGEEKVVAMEKEYFNRKAELRKDIKKWVSLIKPFPSVFEAFRAILKEEKTVIASTREKKAILTYLKSQGINFPAGKVYDWSISHSKTEQFREIFRIEKVPFERMVFIEDVVLNALAVKKLGVNVLLSTWGFSSKSQWSEAKENGIEIIMEQKQLLPAIRKALNSMK